MERTIRIAIADSDKEYVERLATGIAGYPEFEISTFSNADSLEEVLNTRTYDIVLFSQDMGYTPKPAARCLFVPLMENVGEVSGEYQSYRGILKYQRISRIYKELLEQFSEMRGEIRSEEKAFVIAVFSPVGGAGKTTLSMIIAEHMAAQGYRVLYQNMEQLPSGGAYLNEVSDEHGISQLLEYLDRDIDFPTKIKSLLQTGSDNLFYMNSFRTPNDLKALTEKDLGVLFDKLRGAGLFDCIVADMSSSIFDLNTKMFDIADSIVVVGRSGDAAAEKLKRFYSQSNILNRFQSKMVQIDNFDCGVASAVHVPVPVLGKISMYQNAEISDIVQQIATGKASAFLDQLMY